MVTCIYRDLSGLGKVNSSRKSCLLLLAVSTDPRRSHTSVGRTTKLVISQVRDSIESLPERTTTKLSTRLCINNFKASRGLTRDLLISIVVVRHGWEYRIKVLSHALSCVTLRSQELSSFLVRFQLLFSNTESCLLYTSPSPRD